MFVALDYTECNPIESWFTAAWFQVLQFWPEYHFYTKIHMPRFSPQDKCLPPLMYYVRIHRMTLNPQLSRTTLVHSPAVHLDRPRLWQHLPSHSHSLCLTQEAPCQFLPPAPSQRMQPTSPFWIPVMIWQALQKYKTSINIHSFFFFRPNWPLFL